MGRAGTRPQTRRIGEAMTRDIEIELVLDDWQRACKSIYNTEEGLVLSLGALHSGTVFHGTIRLDVEEEAHLLEAMKTGAYPTFRLLVKERKP